jgi:zinc/manganese transport system substrate-binding protein
MNKPHTHSVPAAHASHLIDEAYTNEHGKTEHPHHHEPGHPHAGHAPAHDEHPSGHDHSHDHGETATH